MWANHYRTVLQHSWSYTDFHTDLFAATAEFAPRLFHNKKHAWSHTIHSRRSQNVCTAISKHSTLQSLSSGTLASRAFFTSPNHIYKRPVYNSSTADNWLAHSPNQRPFPTHYTCPKHLKKTNPFSHSFLSPDPVLRLISSLLTLSWLFHSNFPYTSFPQNQPSFVPAHSYPFSGPYNRVTATLTLYFPSLHWRSSVLHLLSFPHHPLECQAH